MKASHAANIFTALAAKLLLSRQVETEQTNPAVCEYSCTMLLEIHKNPSVIQIQEPIVHDARLHDPPKPLTRWTCIGPRLHSIFAQQAADGSLLKIHDQTHT